MDRTVHLESETFIRTVLIGSREAKSIQNGSRPELLTYYLELNVKIKNLGIQFKVEDSLDSIPSPPPSVKIQIIGGKVY